jgi:hypothetical protein
MITENDYPTKSSSDPEQSFSSSLGALFGEKRRIGLPKVYFITITFLVIPIACDIALLENIEIATFRNILSTSRAFSKVFPIEELVP